MNRKSYKLKSMVVSIILIFNILSIGTVWAQVDLEHFVTRIEFILMVNERLEITKIGNAYFKDVDEKVPYYEEIQKAVVAGYIKGYEDATLRPNEFITKEHAQNIIKILGYAVIDETKESEEVQNITKREAIEILKLCNPNNIDQSDTGIIVGKITSGENIPKSYRQVMLEGTNIQTVAKGEVHGGDGTFILYDVPKGKYNISYTSGCGRVKKHFVDVKKEKITNIEFNWLLK